jgi:putative DNA primase/helicase
MWDADPMLLGTPTSGLEKHHCITKSTSVAPAAGEPRQWLAFLNQATNADKGLQRFLQQMCGYCLTGLTREHALFFIYGPGGNGKSVFLNTVISILADYAVIAAMDTFTASKGERHSTEIAMLRGARLVAVSETEEGRAWKESLIKALTGGERVTARFMRQDNFMYIPQFKLIIISNHKPRLRNADDAMRRRINIIPFIHKPDNPDQHLEQKLKAEHQQILQWMLDGRADWLKNGLIRPDIVKSATETYFETQDLFGQWIEENCDTGRNKSASASSLYADWKAYAERAGENPGSQVRFADNMDKRGFMKRRTMYAREYEGVSLKPKEKAEWMPYRDDL